MASRGHFHTDYGKFLHKDGVKGKRIGLLKDALGFSVKVDTLIRQAAADLVQQGAIVLELESPQGKYEDASYQVLLYEFKDGLNNYLHSLGSDAPIQSLADLIAFNKNDSLELRFFDQKILEAAEAKGNLETKEYREALATMLKATREQGIDKLMDDHRLDALLAPTGSPAWKTDLILGDHFVGGSSSLAAISGYPAITVPAGFVDDLPVGVTFFGRAWSEPQLLEIAFAFEQATKHRKPPQFKITD
jgi:amidase